MKKLLLVAFCATLFVASADAQKQAGGEKNFQVLFAPLGGTPVSISGIQFRKFNATGTSAWRLNLFIGLTNKTDVLVQANDTLSYPTSDDGGNWTHGSNPQADKRTSTMTIGIRPGIEKHFAGTDKLSPYIGAELMFQLVSAKTETDSINLADYTIDYTATTANTPYQLYTLTKKGKGGSTTFGLNLLAGCDFYFTKNLSMGAEFGFGFSMTSMPDVTDEYLKVTTTNGTSSVSSTHVVTAAAAQKQGKSTNVGPNAVGQLKLGWLFN